MINNDNKEKSQEIDNEIKATYKKKHTLKIIIICITIVIVLTGIGLWLYFYLTNSPFLGTWIREIEQDGVITSIKFEVKRNKTFTYEQRKQNDISSINGKWEATNSVLTMKYVLNNKNKEYDMYLIDQETICMGIRDCEEFSKIINETSPKDKKYVIETTQKEEIIEIINYDYYKDLINKNDTSVIILGGDYCSYCKSYIDSIMKIENLNFKVYYLSLNNLSKEQYINIHDSYNAIKTTYNDEGEPVIPTPTTIIIKNGLELISKIGNIGENGFINLLKNYNIIN